jgi:uncharacterized protein Yka (UPF0111/DUF47 family)
VKRLNTTFIAPIDREDIYALASRLDDVLDLIDAVADRLLVYKINKPTGFPPARPMRSSAASRGRPWPRRASDA